MCRCKNAGARNKGFTLIELLVAISILAIVAVLGWRGLDTIVRTRVALNAELENTRGMQLTFAQMQSDCEKIDTNAAIKLLADENKLTFTRTVTAENQPSGLQVVAYRVKDGILSRRESRTTRDISVLDSFLRATLEDTDNAPAVVLQSGVDSMAVKLWSGTAGPWRTNAATPGAPQDTGLAVDIKLRGSETGVTKIFLLGGQ